MRRETIPGFGRARGAALALLALAPLSACVWDAHAQTDKYVYIEELPEWASYAGDVMYESTKYWEERLPGMAFYQVDDPAQADFRVQWVKEFGVEHVGYALGTHFIEVGLGDSDCEGRWSPYSSKYVTEIMAHEIGHVLGYGHVDDPSDIMYPIALNREYGLVEREITTTESYGHFEPFCTAKDVSSFAYHVSIEDPTYGFDVYVVPDGSALDDWAAGEPFEYYADSACFGENYLSYGGTCSGVSRNAGLLILSPDLLTEPLTAISVQFQEVGSETVAGAVQPEREALAQPEVFGADETLALFVDPMKRYTMKYPSSWSIYDPALDHTLDGAYDGPSLVGFFNDELYADISLSLYDIGYSTLSDDDILEVMVEDEEYFCESAAESGYACSDFFVIDTYTSVLDSGLKAYNVEYGWTYSQDGQSYETFTRAAEVHSGTAAWYMLAETDLENGALFYDLIDSVIGSFAFTAPAPISEGGSPNAIPTRAEPETGETGEVGTLEVERDVYDVWQQGDMYAIVHGTVDPRYAGIRIALTYTYPDGRTDGKMISYVPPGNFEASFPLSRDSPAGTYEVMASVGDRVIGTASFDVAQPPPASAGSLREDGQAELGGAVEEPESPCGPDEYLGLDGTCKIISARTPSPQTPDLGPAAPDAGSLREDGQAELGGAPEKPQQHLPAPPDAGYQAREDGLAETVAIQEPDFECGPGTVPDRDGVCQLASTPSGGGCLVATAAYGTELAPQVQRLREIRDGVVLGTESGKAFMEAFNLAYYALSPTVADWERQSPALRQAVLYALAPALWSLSVLEHADASDAGIAAYGAAVLVLNGAMYAGIPASSAVLLKRRLRTRRPPGTPAWAPGRR